MNQLLPGFAFVIEKAFPWIAVHRFFADIRCKTLFGFLRTKDKIRHFNAPQSLKGGLIRAAGARADNKKLAFFHELTSKSRMAF
jgi:hypothetical protein